MKDNRIMLNVISYIGDDNRRLPIVKKSMKWLNDFTDKYKIVFLLNNWNETEINKIKIEYPNFDYIINETRLTPGQSRNILLKHFYNSKFEYSFFLDDDLKVTNDDKISVMEYIEKLFLEDFDFDCVNFTNRKYTNKRTTDLNISNIISTGLLAGGCFILKNLKQVYGKEIYFDEDCKVCEDREFAIQLVYNRMKTFLISNPFFYELTSKSILFEDEEDRIIKHNEVKKYMVIKWTNILKTPSLIRLNKNGAINLTKFYKIFQKKVTYSFNI